MPILAIDQSTSATKALLYDGDFRVIERASVSHPSIFPQTGWVEQDAGQIYHNALAVIERAGHLLLWDEPERIAPQIGRFVGWN